MAAPGSNTFREPIVLPKKKWLRTTENTLDQPRESLPIETDFSTTGKKKKQKTKHISMKKQKTKQNKTILSNRSCSSYSLFFKPTCHSPGDVNGDVKSKPPTGVKPPADNRLNPVLFDNQLSQLQIVTHIVITKPFKPSNQ